MTDAAWFDKTLGDVILLQRGFDLTEKSNDPGPYPVISSGGVSYKTATPKVDGPGVVTGRKGVLGKVHFSEGPYWPHDTTLWVKDFKGNDPRYVYYLLHTLPLAHLDAGASNPTLNRNHAHLLRVRVPDVGTQRKIAVALASFDDLIENNRRRIEILEEMARLLYREWFVHFRFPGHENVQLVDSELGRIPLGWEVAAFSEVASFINGFAFKPSEHWLEEGLPIVKIRELKSGVTADTPRYHGEDIKREYFINDGDVLFSWSADLDAYIWSGGPALLNQHLFVVRPYELANALIFHSLRARMDDFRSRSQGTTMKHIKRSALSEVRTVVPSRAVGDEFEGAVRPMLELQLNLAQQNRALTEARNLLLPRLISGGLDVSDLDLDLESVA